MKTHSIIVTDPRSDAPKLRPIMHFSDLPSTQLLGKAPFAAFKAPTPIQAASWPFTLSGRDLIGVAETGSGKTMAFALPCVESVLSTAAKGAVGAVIVSPTRELAMQTHDQMTTLADLVGLNCVCLFGGASKTTQRAILDKGVDIIVATPGRLKDFMSDGTVSLAEAAFVVLDEADRMLDTGFEQDIKDILSTAPPREQRQTMMFTATWPASVQALASSFMVDPVKIAIGSGGKETVNGAVELQANARIAQHVEVIDHHAKEARLLQILKQRQQGKARNDRILVFCLYKKEAVRVENFLRQRGVRVASIHGDLPQEKRTKSLEAFKSGHTPVLVATDVAARGLDIPEVKLVINVTVRLHATSTLLHSWASRTDDDRRVPVSLDHRGLRPPHRPNWPRRQRRRGHHALYRGRQVPLWIVSRGLKGQDAEQRCQLTLTQPNQHPAIGEAAGSRRAAQIWNDGEEEGPHHIWCLLQRRRHD
jgi:ATP-dependent RNA helicase DBP3